ncbi:unnamed protein product [Nesidiocoris tenuis]|uniref:Uncharacterized protein n=1 Tax=Nesidiocoris tenuis TaxID=355587 RepID=A0A6H5HIX6_9HEMI|nr:unnamed protein product [Nesidiocoris tenuis]
MSSRPGASVPNWRFPLLVEDGFLRVPSVLQESLSRTSSSPGDGPLLVTSRPPFTPLSSVTLQDARVRVAPRDAKDPRRGENSFVTCFFVIRKLMEPL